jgi:Domain of unknown function (DUF3883)
MNDATESGIEYADVPYVAYEYPTRYRKKIRPGEPFVYYRSRARAGGGRQPQVYLGTGIIGEIRESSTAGRLICQILDGEEFIVPLPFKDAKGNYLEPDGSRRGYFQQGVRGIPEDAFQRIVALGGGGPMDGSAYDSGSGAEARGLVRPGYATAANAQETERQSRIAVAELLAQAVPEIEIVEMATNNPGFDLETSAGRFRFVEVKGTIKRLPTFFLSEGERRFGAEHSEAYLLAVVYGMDLERESHEDIALSRAPLLPGELLNPFQWAGRLPASALRGPSSLELL